MSRATCDTDLYQDLRRAAQRLLRHERRDHTLQPTALVHEAFLRVAANTTKLDDRDQIRSLLAQAMRRTLVDHARRRRVRQEAARARAGRPRPGDDAAVLAMHEALIDLAITQPRQAHLIELCGFGGYTHREAAAILGVSLRTATRDWARATAWLRRHWHGDDHDQPATRRR
ncbi:MAG: ECF-type sigma factor [Planctomycetota bacterium]